MNKDEAALQKFIADFRQEFLQLPFEQVAFPRGIKGIEKYQDNSQIYMKGTPIQVKGALLFNNLLKTKKIKSIPPIVDGDKVKFAYLKMPNPIHDTVIATPDEMPPEFNLDKYIDRDLQFEKSFLSQIVSITETIDWNLSDKATLEDFFG